MASRKPLASADAAWLRMERPTNLMMIAGIITFDERLTMEILKPFIVERLLIFPRFRQRVVDPMSNPQWEDDPYFDLDRHLHRSAVPEPGGQDELEAFVSDLMSTPLDLSRAPWEMHLIEHYHGGSALIVRLHHCIGDGIALIHVMISMADEYFDPSNIPAGMRDQADNVGMLARVVRPVTRMVKGTVKTTGAVLDEGFDLLLKPGHLLNRAKQGMSIGAATSKLLLLSPDSDTVFRGELGASKRVAWSQPLALQTIKNIARGIDAKINDVLVASVAGALRRYLLAHDESVADVNLRAAIPVNLRPLDEAYKLGNHFGLVFLSLPVGIEDAQERLLEVKQRMDRIKNSAEAAVVLGILQTIGSLPKAAQDQVVNIFSTKASAVLTNVPGPRERLHFQGRTIRNVMFWVPRAGDISMGISIMSYAGTVLIGVATDVHLVPDPSAIIEDFHDEFEALARTFG